MAMELPNVGDNFQLKINNLTQETIGIMQDQLDKLREMIGEQNRRINHLETQVRVLEITVRQHN